jgi:thiamine-monophosphate kinase
VSITAMGLVPAGGMVRRTGARPGDAVLVTGTIGDAALGFAALTGGLDLPQDERAALVARYTLPQPRAALAAAIATFATAALDVSDGLAADFAHLCRASGVAGTIWTDRVPLSGPASRILAREPGRITDILAGGDDYEILLTAPSAAIGALADAAERVGVPLACIGVVEAGEPGFRLVDGGGRPVALARTGWTHA